MSSDNNQNAFFALLRAGLWGKLDGETVKREPVDWSEVLRLAEEQSVVGLVAAGIEAVQGSWTSQAAEPSAWLKVHGSPLVPQEWALQFIGQTLQIEQRNVAMNRFIVNMLSRLQEAGVESVLIKGQGVAQCYERPQWRTCGDVDLLLNEENYEKGKTFLAGKITDSTAKEYSFNKEYQVNVDGWTLELHGSLRCGLSAALNRGVDAIQQDICDNHHVRYWELDGMRIPLPEVNDDVLVIFTHFIKHFYKGELGVRQICDWCRLLFCYREKLDLRVLESRIRRMGLMAQWKGFGAFAVDYLGMPSDAMPFYSPAKKWSRKADRICAFVMEVGRQVLNGRHREWTHGITERRI